MARANRERTLARAVAKGFLQAGFSTADLLTGPINMTDLPWQCPPLQCQDELDKIPLSDYLNYTIGVNGEALERFWKRGLEGLYHSPALVVTPQGWRDSVPVARGVSAGERALRFSVPEGFPSFSSLSIFTFTLEVVSLFMQATKVKKLVETPNTYYVVTEQGTEVGIIEGTVPGTEEWVEPLDFGMIDVILTSGRGLIASNCRYDLLAKLRSMLHEHSASFEEFGGMDWALQALQKLSQDKLCTELLTAVEATVPDNFEARRKIKIIDEALDLLDTWVINDRVKLASMWEMLVPTVFNASRFYSYVFDITKPMPAMMSHTTQEKIKRNLLRHRGEQLKNISARDRASLQRE